MRVCDFDDEKNCPNDICVGKSCPLNPNYRWENEN